MVHPLLQVFFATKFTGFTAATFGEPERARFIADMRAAIVLQTGFSPGEGARRLEGPATLRGCPLSMLVAAATAGARSPLCRLVPSSCRANPGAHSVCARRGPWPPPSRDAGERHHCRGCRIH